MGALIVFSTFPDSETAQRIGRILVEEHLATCVNLLPGVQSIYWWKGVVESGTEVLAIFKTNEGGYPKLESRLKELHPYELPEIVAVQPSEGLPDYLQWVVSNCG